MEATFIVGVVGMLVVGFLYMYRDALRLTYLIRKRNEDNNNCVVISKEYLKSRPFVSIHKGRYTGYWSNVRTFSFWQAKWYILTHRNIVMVNRDCQYLLTSKGE